MHESSQRQASDLPARDKSMPIRLPALPALVAARALQADAALAARRALEQVRQLLAGYDLLREVLDDLPPASREDGAAALLRRLRAADRKALSCQERLEEATGFCASLRAVDSPTALVEVSANFFEMLSPYLDEAMEPVLARISRRTGLAPSDVEMIFPRPRPAIAA